MRLKSCNVSYISIIDKGFNLVYGINDLLIGVNKTGFKELEKSGISVLAARHDDDDDDDFYYYHY